MTRHALRAGVFIAAVLWILTAPSVKAADSRPVEQTPRIVLDLRHIDETRAPHARRQIQPFRQLRHRLYLELDGARAQAEDWLHTAGVSLLEQRDSEGRRTYQLLSGALVSDWLTVKLHARIGGPELSTGLQPKREIPAFGITIPGQAYTFEFEGMRDRGFGTALMARMRWGTARQRVQYGIAVPVTLGGSVGALIQLRIRLGE